MARSTAILILGLWLGAATSEAQSTRVRDSSNIRIIENVLTSTSARFLVVKPTPSVTIGGPSPARGVELASVTGAVRLRDGGIVLGDGRKNQLFFLDSTGRLRVHVDATGPSAGQFQFVWGLLRWGKDTAVAWDGWNDRLNFYNRKGDVVRSDHTDNPPRLRLDNGSARQAMLLVGLFANGERLAWTRNTEGMRAQGVEPDSSTVFHISAGGKLTEITRVLRSERFRWINPRYGAHGTLPFGRVGSIATYGSSWYYTDGSAFQISQLSSSGRLELLIRLDRARAPVSEPDIQRYSTARLARTDPVLRADYQSGLKWVPYPTTKPAYTALAVDPAGTLWARLWANDDEPSTWDLFDRTGHYLGAVEVPADLVVLEVGVDYLLARYTRTFDVEEVRLYQLVRGKRRD